MRTWITTYWHQYRRLISYLMCSVISTVFDVTIVWCLLHLAGVSLVVSNTVGVIAGFIISYLLSAKRAFEVDYTAATFTVYFVTFLMGLFFADVLIVSTHTLVSPFLPLGLAFLVSKGVSIVGPFFLMYFIRKYAFRLLEKKRKGT